MFHTEYLGQWRRLVVIYRCVGKYADDELRPWLDATDPAAMQGVFVGASSRDKPVRTSLAQAHALRQEVRPDLPIGGVVITERYTAGGDEHLRMLAKQERAYTFFISQVVYDVGATKSLVSDYFYTCRQRGGAPVGRCSAPPPGSGVPSVATRRERDRAQASDHVRPPHGLSLSRPPGLTRRSRRGNCGIHKRQ